MSEASAARVFPLSPDGAAADVSLPKGHVRLEDLSALPRFGLKGPGSAAWLESAVGPLPGVNQVLAGDGLRILRLGGEDLLLTGPACETLAATWRKAEGSRGYWSWREEGWAWMRLSGQAAGDVMARLCAIDFRPGSFPADGLAQTRVGQVEAVVIPDGDRFDLFFDVASTAYLVRAIGAAAQRAASAVRGEAGG